MLTAQHTETLPLWPTGAIPHALPNDTVREQSVINDDNVLILSDITVPTLTAYLPVPDKATGAAVLVVPGGGYWIVAAGHEGADVARWFNQIGVAAFVLKYRLPDPRLWSEPRVVPLEDARQAVRLIRNNAAKWGIQPHKTGVLGFSAGGHLASTLCTHTDGDSAQTALTRPDWAVLVYPVVSFGQFAHQGSRDRLLGPLASDPVWVERYSNELQVTAQTPPTILLHSLDDTAVPYQNSLLYTEALRRHGVDAELHLFQNGGHGYGLGPKVPGAVPQWPDLVAAWLQMRGLAKK